MKTFKDVAFLYPNVDVKTDHPNYTTATLLSANGNGCWLNNTESGVQYFDWENVKITPVLRSIEDMTQEELIAITKLVYISIFGENIDVDNIQPKEVVTSGGSVGLISHHYGFDERLGLTIEIARGVEFSVESSKMNIPQFDVFAEVLKMGIDLFNLIDNNEAVENANNA